jgi:hypothetical protein
MDLHCIPGTDGVLMPVTGLEHTEGVAWHARASTVYAGGDPGQLHHIALDALQATGVAELGDEAHEPGRLAGSDWG